MKIFLFLAMLLMMFTLGAAAQQAASPAAELEFVFTRQSGSASNQFAVWIEDANGNYVKTIYATRYTANGGFKRRETSIPVWVKKSNLAALNKAQVDALTGATPRAGTLTYTWDGTDSRGAAMPAGNYVFRLEATLRWENQANYRAPISLGRGPAAAAVSVEYSNASAPERGMISGVKARSLR